MKKSLIALAALAATGLVSAQSSVTMFGVVDIAYGAHKTSSRDGAVFTKTGGVMDGSQAGSRIGFRGTEDLGGGLKASFHLEQGVSPTQPEGYDVRVGSGAHQVIGNGTHTTGNNRQSFLGLAGGFGELRIGYQYTNSYDLVTFNGLNPSEFQGGNYQNASHANGGRANVITYIAPTISGLTIKAQVGGGTGRGTVESNSVAATSGNGFTKNNNKYMSLSAVYKAGNLTVGAAYSKADLTQENAVNATITNAFGVAGTPAAAANTRINRSPKALHIVGGYNFGMARVAATITDASNDGSFTSATASKTKAQQLALWVPFGAAEAFISTGKSKVTPTGGAATTDQKGTAFGVRYNLSKRTVAYAFSGTDKNSALTGATAGYKDSKTAVGVAHTF
jgi:predicted porin